LVGDVKKPGGIILTGKKRARGQWLEVVVNGRHGWVNGAAVVTAKPGAPGAPIKRILAIESQPTKRPAAEVKRPARPQAPVAVPQTGQYTPFARAPQAPQAHAPAIAPAPQPMAQPVAQAAPELPDEPRPEVPVTRPAAPISPPVAAAPPVAPAPAAQAPVPMPPKPPVKTVECAKNMRQFERSALLVKTLGEHYNPFVRWSGPYGTAIEPDSHGTFIMTIPSVFAAIAGRPARSPLPLQICASAKEKRAYVMVYDKRFNFNDRDANSLTLSQGGQTGTFEREQAVR